MEQTSTATQNLAQKQKKGTLTLQVKAAEPYNRPHDKIFVAGTFNHWNPHDEAFVMESKRKGIFEIKIPVVLGIPVEYKYTRGSWDSAEANRDGSETQNRHILIEKSKKITDVITEWKGQKPSTASPNVHFFGEKMPFPQLNTERKVWVYLPLGYQNNPAQRYPVLYMQDGQNLFDARYASYGEWGIDKIMNQIEQKTRKGAIIIATEHAHEKRIHEYSPFPHPHHGGGQANEYLDFLVNTLKPLVDKQLRTLPDRENTLIGGSSMGGLVSLYGGLKHQETFGKWLIFSPSLWFSSQIFDYAQYAGKRLPCQIYLMAGEKESKFLVPNLTRMYKILKNSGFEDKKELKFVLRPEGSHSEHFWGSEFGEAYKWLFGI